MFKASWLTALLVSFISISAQAAVDKIEVPEEELAQETVLPVFDRVEAVKNRNRVLKERFEFGLGLGFNLTEAVYNNKSFNFWGGYNFDESHAVTVAGVFIQDGLSSMGEDLKSGKNIEPDALDASKAPHPETLIIADYQFTAYYGKISLSKDYVVNLSVYGLAGLGLMNFGDSTSPTLDVGVGQKLYFGNRLAFRADLHILAYQGPNIADDNVRLDPAGPSVSSGDLDKIMYFHTYLNLGLVFVL